MSVGTSDKPVEGNGADKGFCVFEGRGRNRCQEFSDFTDAGAAIALIFSCGGKTHCLANVFLMNSVNSTAASYTVVTLNHDRDLVLKSPDFRVCNWQVKRTCQFQAEVLIFGMTVEFSRWRFENVCSGHAARGNSPSAIFQEERRLRLSAGQAELSGVTGSSPGRLVLAQGAEAIGDASLV